jgi:hypothetical protein
MVLLAKHHSIEQWTDGKCNQPCLFWSLSLLVYPNNGGWVHYTPPFDNMPHLHHVTLTMEKFHNKTSTGITTHQNCCKKSTLQLGDLG